MPEAEPIPPPEGVEFNLQKPISRVRRLNDLLGQEFMEQVRGDPFVDEFFELFTKRAAGLAGLTAAEKVAGGMELFSWYYGRVLDKPGLLDLCWRLGCGADRIKQALRLLPAFQTAKPFWVGLRIEEAWYVTVRFAPSVARWVRERYREVEDQDDGGVTVQLPATSTQWLVRRVLEYGDDAEVIGPAAYREAVRRAVA